jgi:D-aminopeptidase
MREDEKSNESQDDSVGMFNMRVKKRARDLSVPFPGNPGPLNAITDIGGVEVGHSTIISGEGRLVVGEGPVRTGVTAILPRGRNLEPVFAGWFSLNGNGEMTGTTWIEESGFLEGPFMITNTHSVGVVRDSVVEWINKQRSHFHHLDGAHWSLPVVAETYDGRLNDINGFHVEKRHAFEALDTAKQGPVEEGNVGGGTGMTCHQFKGGIGTSSRTVTGSHSVGVLVQANYGSRELLTISGVPVGREIPNFMPVYSGEAFDGGSIIVVVATDAPVLPHQLKRMARRVPLGISKLGGISGNGSGDIFIAFSTANQGAFNRHKPSNLIMLPNDQMSELFQATVDATEEAIVNALVAADTMTGINGNTVHALPHERLMEVLKKYNRFDARR